MHGAIQILHQPREQMLVLRGDMEEVRPLDVLHHRHVFTLAVGDLIPIDLGGARDLVRNYAQWPSGSGRELVEVAAEQAGGGERRAVALLGHPDPEHRHCAVVTELDLHGAAEPSTLCDFDAQLAEALEVSVGSIAGWKKGVRAPSLRVQQQLLAKIRESDGKRKKKRAGSKETEDLVKRLLSLAPEVKDPSALIEAAHALLKADAEEG